MAVRATSDAAREDDILLSVEGLTTVFHTDEGLAPAVEDVSLSVRRGQILGVVGESGCGKTVTALSVLRLIAAPPGKIAAGRVVFEGTDLLTLPEAAMCDIRGNRISMIFQEPMTSLNPVHTVGRQVAEALILHQRLSSAEALRRVVDMFQLVGISDAEQRLEAYPHQLSGGLRQRVMIAMALACNPRLLIADEPTTALDVTVQAQILRLIRDLQRRTGMAIMLITHDLGVVADLADEVCVMYAGKVVELGDVFSVFDDPRHPYTVGLYNSVPKLAGQREEELKAIRGVVPSPLRMPKGCRFAPRCDFALDRCRREPPPPRQVGPNHVVACWREDYVR